MKFNRAVKFGASGTATFRFTPNANPAPSSLTLDEPFAGDDKIITDAGLARGGNESYLNLSGTGTQDTALQYLDHGTSTWKDLNATWAGSTWTANDVPYTASAVVDWNDDATLWWPVEIRERDNTAATAASTTRFRPGVVISSLSQSERDNIWNRESSPGMATVVNEAKMQILSYTTGETTIDFEDDEEAGGTNTAAWKNYHKRDYVTNARYAASGGSSVSTPIVAISNLFDRLIPDYPILLVDNQWSGTGRDALAMDNDGKVPGQSGYRTWKALQINIDWLAARNSYVGIQDEMWWNAERSKSASWAAYVCPLYTGQYKDGTTYTIGDVVTDSITVNITNTTVFDHIFFDLDVNADQFGRGVYRRDRTVVSWMGTNPYNSWPNSVTNGTSGGDPPTGLFDSSNGNAKDLLRKNSETAYVDSADLLAGTVVIDNNPRRLRQSVGEVFDDSTTNFANLREVVTAWTFDNELCLYGDYDSNSANYTDRTHPAKGATTANQPYDFEVNALHGWVLTAKYIALSVCKAIQKNSGSGVVSTSLPVPVLAIDSISSNGTSITFKAVDERGNDLPDGYKLSTYREAATGVDLGTDKDLTKSEVNTGALTFDPASIRNVPEVLGFDIILASSYDPTGDNNMNVVVSDAAPSSAAPINNQADWGNHQEYPYTITFDDAAGTFTLTFDTAPTEDYYIRYGWGSTYATTAQYGIHDKHYMNIPMVTVPNLASNRTAGSNTTSGLTGCSLDNLVGLPVAGYPRAPLWEVDISANTATKRNAHSFSNLNSSALEPGTETFGSWAAFSNDTTGDGMGLDLTGNTDDALIADAVPAATFLTPFMNDNADLTELAVLVHPTSYFKADGTFQEDPDVYIYANGNRKKATKTSDPYYGDLDVYKVDVANLSGRSVEFRAVVVPQYGTPAILQVQDNTWVDDGADWRLYLSGRGCVSHDYTVVNVDASSGQTLVSESSTNPATRYVVTGQGTGWSDAFSTHDIVATPIPYATNPMTQVWPIVDGALLKMECGDTTFCRGLIYHNCDIRWWPDSSTTVVNRDIADKSKWWDVGSGIKYTAPDHDTYRQTNNCVVSIPEDTSYTIGEGLDPNNGNSPANPAVVQDHISRGFGTFIHAYEFGANPTKIGWHPAHGSGNKCRSSQYDTTFKFVVSTANETVNCNASAVGSFNDIYNSDILVNSSAAGIHKMQYPWGSCLADAANMQYNYNFDSYDVQTSDGNPVITELQITDAYEADEANALALWTAPVTDNTTPPTIEPADLPIENQQAINAGIWPDMGYGKYKYTYNLSVPDSNGNTTKNEFYDITYFFKQGDGTYVDHMGYTYTTWDKTWDLAQDPHFDWCQHFNTNDTYRRDFTVQAKCRIYGNETTSSYQGLFFNGATTLKALAMWDHEFTVSKNAIPLSYGYNNGDENYPDAAGSRLYGPSMAEVESWTGPTYGGQGQAIRDYFTNRTNPNSNSGLNQIIVDQRLATDAGMDVLTNFKWSDSGGAAVLNGNGTTTYTRAAFQDGNTPRAEVKILDIPSS